MPDVNYPSCERATISVAAGEKGRTTLVQRTCIERSGKNSYRATLNLHEQKVTSDDHVSADFTLELRRCEDDRPVEVISNSGGSSEKLSVSTSSISGVRVYAVSSVPSARLTVLGANGTRSEYTGAGTTSIAEGTCG